MSEALLLALVGCMVGMVALTVSLVAMRPTRAWFHLPLAGLLAAIAVIALPPLVDVALPAHATTAVAAGLPAAMLLGPFLWLYIRALTARTEWRWSRRELAHLLPALAALGVGAGFQSLPLAVREAMVLRGELVEGAGPSLVATLAWLLIMFWVPQSCYYLVRSGRRLIAYRSHLRHVFADTRQRDMTWLTLFILLLGLVWLVVLATAIGANLFNYPTLGRGKLTLLALLAVWILSAWGLSQRPGFHGHYEPAALAGSAEAYAADDETPVQSGDPRLDAETSQPEKYSRSALDQTRSARIARKIEAVMAEQRLYLESDLTLGDLARAVNAPPNYVSQTLNETLGETFFDYVNAKRVEAARQLLRDTDRSALDIAYAVGFNARSSFYKSFQRQTGTTPGKYREEQARGAMENGSPPPEAPNQQTR